MKAFIRPCRQVSVKAADGDGRLQQGRLEVAAGRESLDVDSHDGDCM